MERLPGCATNDGIRYEVLPLGKSEEEAAGLPEAVRLTVTCSPKHGPDRSVDVAGRLHAMGHRVTVHVAARMVRDGAHLDELLAAMGEAGVDDMFLIGGDADPALGDYGSAVDLLPALAEHPRRPSTIGIAGYPEGHPLIERGALERALIDKSRLADYVTTQMCFDPETVRRWVADQRRGGMTLPVLVGMPGKVSAARLFELSARIGVGPSMAFVRKQRGLRKLLGIFRGSASDRLHDALEASLGDRELGIAGFHYFTFNQLIATYEWHQTKLQMDTAHPAAVERATRPYARPEESKT
jgi:methylenetetrahydrofolate reductase (NADPH)